MCVERVTKTLSSLPNSAYTATRLAEKRYLGQSVGGGEATTPITTTTTVVLEGVWEIIQQTLLTLADAAFFRAYGRSRS